MHQEQMQQQQQVIIIQQQPVAVTRGKVLTYGLIPSFPRGLAVALGIAQLFFGIVSIFAASLACVYLAYNYEIGFGFWCGAFRKNTEKRRFGLCEERWCDEVVLPWSLLLSHNTQFFVSAGVAMHAGRRPTRRMMKQLIAWSVISFIFAGVEFGLSIDGLNYNVNYPYHPNTYICWWWYWWTSLCYYNYPAMEAANGLMLSVSGLELLICVWLIYVSARALKQVRPPAAAAAADATVVELQSAPHGGHERRHNPVTVTVVGTSVQPQHLQQQNIAVNQFGPPPTYEVVAPPPYVN